MTLSHTLSGTVLIGTAAIFTAGVVIPAMPPIVVHSLKYEDGEVIQDRTITVDNAATFFARWDAEIVNAATSEVVEDCSGSGSHDYPDGRKAARMDLATWVGNPECGIEDLPPEFYLRASWRWGDSGTQRESGIYQP